jgi:uncharacterized protein (DUF2062 family)/SAM-dependent methyltransferase
MGFIARQRSRLVYYGKLLLSQHRSPGRVAVAIVLGCIVGCLPLTGLQLLICIGLARLWRLNLPIMYGAANISIPPLVPGIAWVSVQLGERLLHGQFLTLSRADFSRAALPGLIKRFFIAWMLGGTIFGGAIGVVGAAIVYVILRRRHKQVSPPDPVAQAIDQALERAAKRYQRAPRKYRYYAVAKYRMDPCYRALCARIPEGVQVVDLGCGLGMLGIALAELPGGRRTLGIDWDAEKIEAGKLAARELLPDTVTLLRDDVRAAALPSCDVITLIDVLHYYDPATQSAILSRAAAALRPGGFLYIRETDPERAGGARLTRWFERLMVRFGWNRGPKVHYRPIPELHEELMALGFTTEQVEVAGATHPGNVLLSGRKATSSAAPGE